MPFQHKEEDRKMILALLPSRALYRYMGLIVRHEGGLELHFTQEVDRQIDRHLDGLLENILSHARLNSQILITVPAVCHKKCQCCIFKPYLV